jgi:hypothetical protein
MIDVGCPQKLFSWTFHRYFEPSHVAEELNVVVPSIALSLWTMRHG